MNRIDGDRRFDLVNGLFTMVAGASLTVVCLLSSLGQIIQKPNEIEDAINPLRGAIANINEDIQARNQEAFDRYLAIPEEDKFENR